MLGRRCDAASDAVLRGSKVVSLSIYVLKPSGTFFSMFFILNFFTFSAFFCVFLHQGHSTLLVWETGISLSRGTASGWTLWSTLNDLFFQSQPSPFFFIYNCQICI